MDETNRVKGRDINGLLRHVKYTFNEDGTIDWRKMIKPEYLVPNKQVFDRKNKPVPESIEGLEDRELLILLGGIKELAQLRGYTHVGYKVECPSNDYVVAVCNIVWRPNYETEGSSVEFSAIGDASHGNTNGFGKNFLGPIAENRSFVRCVRNFLKINIVGQDEVSGATPVDDSDVSSNLLKDAMKKYGVTFEKVKETLIREKLEGAENFKSLDEIPRYKQFELIKRIKDKAAEKEKTATPA